MGERRERVKPEDASDYIALAFEHWRESCDDTYDLDIAEGEALAFLAQVAAERKQAESVLASFNLARHALCAIYEMINLGDPGRNPEVLARIEYAVEEAMTQAEKQTAN